MLSIGKLTGGAASARYYEESVASGREDYYSGRGESQGEWMGTGAEQLGLRGAVAPGELEELLVEGRHPVTGTMLRANATSVQGFDLTFSAPKSVSVLYATGDERLRGRVVAAHESAVRDALGYLEREAVQVRRGKAGAIKQHAGGLVAATYRHRTSRAGDPQLHTHVVAANLAQGADGRWTALHAAPLYTHVKTAGYLYQAALREHLARDLGVRWGRVHRGAAEIAGIPGAVLEHFSQRRAEILELMRERGTTSPRAAAVAALATRRAKDYAVDEATIYERWQARAAEHGLDRAALTGLLGHEPQPLGPEELRRAAGLMSGEHGLTALASTFTRRDALRAWAEHHQAGASVARLEKLTDRWLASNLAVHVDGDRVPVARGDVIATRRGMRVVDREDRYSTPEMLDTERGLVERATARRGRGVATVEPEVVSAALAARPYLADEQRAMVRALTTSGDGVQVVLAKAGAGKTTALDAAREAWQQAGIAVQGTALGSYAAKELRDSGVEACTIAALLRDMQQPGGGLERGSVLIVDEAGMVGTRTLAALADHAAQRDAKLVLVGDDHQLPEIDAGGAFRGLAQRLGAIELRHNRRQDDPADRAALDAYRDGRPDELIASLARRGQITVAADVGQTRRALVAEWWEGAQAEGRANTAMIALRRSEVRALNELARGHLRAAGHLGARELVLDDRAFAVGDRIVTRHNDRRLGVVNGSRGEVTEIADDGSLAVRLDDGRDVRLPLSYVSARRNGQPAVDHGYAITANAIQGGTVNRSYVLGSEELYREWGYVAFSRHRHATRFYVTVPGTPEPERDLTAPGDPLEPIINGLGRSRAKDLAIDTLPEGEVHAMSDEALAAEATRLRAVLATAPAAAAQGLERIDAEHRRLNTELRRPSLEVTHTEDRLAAAPRRDREVLQRRLAGQQRAAERWRAQMELLEKQRVALLRRAGDPDAWLNAHVGDAQRLAIVETELHRRREIARVEALRLVSVDPPDYVIEALGRRPEEPSRRRAWDAHARAIASSGLGGGGRAPAHRGRTAANRLAATRSEAGDHADVVGELSGVERRTAARSLDVGPDR